MKLSLMVHANRNRADRVQCLLTRLTLNKNLHSYIDFEVIVFDGGSTDHTKDLCHHFAKFMPLKYVYCPLEGPTEESYPLSIMSKLCEGEYIGFASADHWISENLVRILSSYEAPCKAIFGAVARSEESKVFLSPVQMVDQLLDDRCSNKEIRSIMELAEIEAMMSSYPEVWSVRRELAPEFGQDWSEQLKNIHGGLQETPYQPAAVDMWSPPQSFIDPPAEFGQLPEYGYAVIDGKTLEQEELEGWCEQRS